MTKKLIAVPILVLAALAIALFAADTAGEQKLQQAIDLMESKGDFAKAIPMFVDVSRSSDPALAALALLHLGQAQERQGADQARATYERIIKEFSNQTETVAAARQRLAALGAPKQVVNAAQRLLCEDCGDTDIDFSSDGRSMVATDWDSGDLEIREASTGQLVHRLMLKTGTFKTSKEEAERPVFSKDARQIAYVWCTGEKPNRLQIRVVANEPGAKPRIVMEKKEYLAYWPVDWTKDGKKLLVILTNPDRTWEIAWVSVADGAVKPIKSVGWRFYGTGARPRLSQDEKFILYSALAVNPTKVPPEAGYSKDEHVYVLSVDGSKENDLVKGSNINDGPVWAPDGAHILFASNRRTTSFDLWSVPVRGGAAAGDLRLVREETGRLHTIAASQSSYFFLNSRKGGKDVFVSTIKQDGTAAPPRRLTEYLGANVGAAWSPDGKSISFKRQRPNTNGPTGGLWDLTVLSLETGQERSYPTGGPPYGRSSWFHDSKAMNVGGGASYARLDLKTGEKTPFAAGFPGGMNAFSPDDKTLYLESDPVPGPQYGIAQQLIAVDIASNQSKPAFVPKAGEGVWGFAVSPDGRSFAIIAGPGNAQGQMNAAGNFVLSGQLSDCHLFTIGVDGSGQRELYSFKLAYPGWAAALTWGHDGRSIYFGVPGEAGTPELRISHIMRIPASGGAPEPVGVSIRNNTLQLPQYIDLSPDDSQIVFSTDEAGIDQIWALDNVVAALK